MINYGCMNERFPSPREAYPRLPQDEASFEARVLQERAKTKGYPVFGETLIFLRHAISAQDAASRSPVMEGSRLRMMRQIHKSLLSYLDDELKGKGGLLFLGAASVSAVPWG